MAAPSSIGGESSNTAAPGNDGDESARNRMLSSKLYFDVPTSKVNYQVLIANGHYFFNYVLRDADLGTDFWCFTG